MERSFDDAFAETLAEFNESAGDELPAAEETAIEAAVPDDVTTPDDDVASLATADEDAEDDQQEAAGPNWDDEANPYRQQAQRAERERRQALEAIARAEQIRQANERNARVQGLIENLPNLEPEQLKAAAMQLMVEAATPWHQKASQADVEAEALAKQTTIQVLSSRYGLNDAESASLVEINDPVLMERYAASMQTSRSERDAQMIELRSQIATLQKQVKAQSRNPQADMVGGATGGPPARKASTGNAFDDYWAANNMDQQFGRAS